jgi:hypothetical protein
VPPSPQRQPRSARRERRTVRTSLRGLLVEAAVEDESKEQRQRRDEDEAAEGDADDGRDEHRSSGGGLLHREARKQLGPLREGPARDDRDRRPVEELVTPVCRNFSTEW